MKEQLIQLFRKWPAFYNLLVAIYSNLKFYLIMERIVGTKAREKEWATLDNTKIYVLDRGTEEVIV